MMRRIALTFVALAPCQLALGCIGAVGSPVGSGDEPAGRTGSAAPTTAGSPRTPGNGAGLPVPAGSTDRLCGSAPARIVKLTAAQYGRTVAGLLPGTAAGVSLGADLDDLVLARSDEFSNNAGTPTLPQPYVAQPLGKAGGAIRTGQYLTFPNKARSMADVWVTLANALDVPIKSFGVPEHNRGSLPGVLS